MLLFFSVKKIVYIYIWSRFQKKKVRDQLEFLEGRICFCSSKNNVDDFIGDGIEVKKE